jgi:hypothetical protein
MGRGSWLEKTTQSVADCIPTQRMGTSASRPPVNRRLTGRQWPERSVRVRETTVNLEKRKLCGETQSILVGGQHFAPVASAELLIDPYLGVHAGRRERAVAVARPARRSQGRASTDQLPRLDRVFQKRNGTWEAVGTAVRARTFRAAGTGVDLLDGEPTQSDSQKTSRAGVGNRRRRANEGKSRKAQYWSELRTSPPARVDSCWYTPNREPATRL